MQADVRETRPRKLGTALAFLVVISCSPAANRADPGEDSSPRSGGTLVFGAEQEPTNGLNWILACCAQVWAGFLADPVLEGAFEYTPDFDYAPVIIESATIEDEPFAITYNIHPQAEWSDGTSITADDFEFTYETVMDPKVEIASRTGYDLVTSVKVLDDKTIRFEFSSPYAAWHELFPMVLPKHALQGENYNKVWTDTIDNPKTGDPIGSGPFLVEGWDKGDQLTLVRNENWWGPHEPYLEEIVFKFVPNTNTEIQQMRGGEVDAIFPQPQFALETLRREPSINVDALGGFLWEFILFNLDRPPLDNLQIRQAIAHSIDRTAAAQHLFSGIAPGVPVQNNAIYIPNQPDYEPHFEIWNHDPDRARELLEAEGCEVGDDGIYICDGRRLSFGIMSTAGNDLRETTFEVLQEDAKAAGIELTNDFKESAIAIGPRGWAGGNYDLFMAAFGGVTDPFLFTDIYGCQGGINFSGYCDEEVTELLRESNEVVDPAERASILNEASSIMAQQLPILPLFQKPMFLATRDNVHGIALNPGANIPWNVEDWWIEQ